MRRQRFLTEDTYLGNKTDTLSINRYIYCKDNPLKFKDPSGKYTEFDLEAKQEAYNMYIDSIYNHFDTLGGMFGEYTDDIFDAEVKTGIGLEYNVDVGPLSAKASFGNEYYSTDEHNNTTYGKNDFGASIELFDNDSLSFGINHNDNDGLSIQVSNTDLNLNPENDDDLKLSFGGGGSIPGVATYGSFKFSINIFKIFQGLFDENYIADLQKRVMEKRGYIIGCH